MKRTSVQHLYLEDGSINPLLLEKDIIICGCGNDGKKLYIQLKQEDAEAAYFCDSNESLAGGKLFGKTILGYRELWEHKDCNLALAFHMWPQVLKKIDEDFSQRVFADFPFEHETSESECILCESNKLTYSKAHFAPFIQERMFQNREIPTRLMHCKNCELHFSEYRPSDKEMNRLYQGYRNEEYQKQRQKYEATYTREYNNKLFCDEKIIMERKTGMESFLKSYLKDFHNFKNVLDWGGDEGQYIPEVFANSRKFVYEISGNQVVDGVTCLNDLSEVAKIKWDFVMCCHLLEHVSDPLEILNHIVHWLKPRGVLYLELPLEERIFQYSDLEISEHINFFSELTMEKIGTVLGLKTLQIQTDRVIRGLYMW